MKKSIISLLLILLGLNVWAQGTRTIKGTVTDQQKEPLIGLVVMVKHTTIGTVTDIDGRFSINVPDSLNTLVFSYVGYNNKEVDVRGKTQVNVELIEDSQQLSEVVIVGYSSQQKRSLTSASVSIVSGSTEKRKTAGTWKRSGMPDNSIRLEVGENDFIPLEAAQMAVRIDGFRVRVLIDCFFYNNKQSGLEGVFKLNLPTGASPYYFAFGETQYIDEEKGDVKSKQVPYAKYRPESFDLSQEAISGRNWRNVKEARIVSKQKAAQAYEQTVSARIDPALMEWAGADMFTCRVFPLTRNTLHRVVIGYDLNMTEALDSREYTMVLPKAEKDVQVDVSIFTSPSMTPSVRPSVASMAAKDQYTYFSLKNPKDKSYQISYNNAAPVMLQSFKNLDDDDSESDPDHDYFAASYRIDLPETKQDKLPSDAVFMLDVSLSSNPDKFNVWLKLVEEILTKNTDIIKRFAVMCFSVDQYWYATYYQKNNYYNTQQFLEYANTLALEGATNLHDALAQASSPPWLKKNAPKHIFLMSDADCNWGETNMHTFQHVVQPGDRVHTYRTGLSGTNVTVLDFLSRSSNGFSFTVTGEEEAELTAKSFRYKPWVVEEVKVDGVVDFLISGQPSQLYNGQKLIFSGRGTPSGAIQIRVNNGTEQRTLNLDAKEKIVSHLAKRVYGQTALAQLENYGFKAEDASISYATYFKVPGQLASFLMLESQWDYDRFGIRDGDAEGFVEDHTVAQVITELESKGPGEVLGKPKVDFMAWLNHLESDKSTIDFEPDSAFHAFVLQLPEEAFMVKLETKKFKLRLAEEQTEDEQTMLSDPDIRYDNMLPLALKRKKRFGKEDGLKLLSSVVERNAGDRRAIRDIAMTAIDWNLGDQAYFMMKRLIDWREGDALAYQTAAQALAKAGYTELAMVYYYICMNSDWDSDYGDFQQIAAIQCLRFLNSMEPRLKSLDGLTRHYLPILKKQVVEKLEEEKMLVDEADLLIAVSWNIDDTDIDLHVKEPDGKTCYYGNRNSEMGGQLSVDVTRGYGPEMYVMRKAADGHYDVTLDYYSSTPTKTASKAKAYIDIYSNWGRDNEQMMRKTIILENRGDQIPVVRVVKKKDSFSLEKLELKQEENE